MNCGEGRISCPLSGHTFCCCLQKAGVFQVNGRAENDVINDVRQTAADTGLEYDKRVIYIYIYSSLFTIHGRSKMIIIKIITT